MRGASFVLGFSVVAVLGFAGTEFRARELASASSMESVDFAEDVLPILAMNCMRCHGGVRELAGLDLSREDRVKTGRGDRGPVVVPHDPSSSELLRRIASSDPDDRMPPEAAPLSSAEVAILRRWVAEGASWGTHWSFRPRADPPIPKTSSAGDVDRWPRRDLDRFVLARLRDHGLAPAPEADRETLLRRVALDLTGLPPDDVTRAAFLADARPGAYERLVDRLLADPAHGERFARVWLDLGRYADTQGYEKDGRREIWAWRDWLVAALNDDLPYDEFVVLLLAGDLVPEARDTDRVASAFHRNTLTNTEGGTDDEEFRMAAVFDRTATTFQAFLGVTFQCVQCHGHPYDPFPQADYYRFLAFLNQTEDEDRDDDSPRLALKVAGVDTSVPVMRERSGEARRTTRVLARGALSSPGEPVEPGVPAILAPRGPSPADRLGMARWIASAENPLFARVAANRAWEVLFGRGLVETSEDFGVMGSGTEDRALLDHLAGVLIARGFSMKALLREIVTSATYRQASVAPDASRARDPDNRLWSRAPRLRLEAEQIRDQALAVSGLLSRRMGGPPVMPPQPEGVWQVVYSGDAWRTSEGDDRHRRAIYTFLRRTSPYPSFLAFDATSRETCTVRRIRTNTPLAALVTLNDPVYAECAQALAAAFLGEPDDRAAVAAMLGRALGRRPLDAEVERLSRLVALERARYAGREELARVLAGRACEGVGAADPARAAALVAAANAILNLDDFLTRS